VEGFISKLPEDSPWRQRRQQQRQRQEINNADADADADAYANNNATTTPNNDDDDDMEKNNNNDNNTAAASSSSTDVLLPTLRVIVLDGVYSQARSMFKTIKRRFPTSSVPIPVPPHVALHPKTLSVYHRALKNYAQSSAVTVRNSSDPNALHICSVEALALLMKELGEWEQTTKALVKAVEINNLALVHSLDVRPPAQDNETKRKEQSAIT